MTRNPGRHSPRQTTFSVLLCSPLAPLIWMISVCQWNLNLMNTARTLLPPFYLSHLLWKKIPEKQGNKQECPPLPSCNWNNICMHLLRWLKMFHGRWDGYNNMEPSRTNHWNCKIMNDELHLPEPSHAEEGVSVRWALRRSRRLSVLLSVPLSVCLPVSCKVNGIE